MSLTFRPYADVGADPNVIVDGTPTTNTTLTLSHWPRSPRVPLELQADLSAQMAFAYLDHPEALHGGARWVSNNHFDQDGTVGIFALVDPDRAVPRRALLEDVAAAGDFATYRHRDAARASMVLAAFADPDRSPFAPLPDDYDSAAAVLYGETLPRLVEVVDGVERYRRLWEEEDAALSDSEAAIADGTVRIEERPEVDLAVVTVAGDHRSSGHRFCGSRYEGVHPMALHNSTRASALLLLAPDGRYRFTYRYETWVQYRSRPVRARRDLAPLAVRLSEVDAAPWQADRVDGLTPHLAPRGHSELDPAFVAEAVVAYLHEAAPAFDPFATG